MNQKVAIIVTTLILGSIFLLTTRTPQKENESDKIKVVTSFYPLAYIATAVGDGLVTVNNLAPAGIEPHDFEPSPQQFVDIGKADLFFYNGAGFEPWVKRWEMSTPLHPSYVVNMSSILNGHKVTFIEENGVINPHFWLDPIIFIDEVHIVRDALILVDPRHKEIFHENANRLISALEDLDLRFRGGLSLCALHDIIVSHKAFEYLARRYGFSTVSIAGVSPEEEPAPKDLARTISLAREKGVRHIFSETIASPKFSEAVAREIDGVVLVLNPIESLTPNEVQLGQDYISAMGMNLNNLRTAMICK